MQVGGVARWNWDDKWWERAFDSAAQTVDKDSSSDSSDSDSDDDEIDAARIAAAINGGTPAASTGARNRDGTATTASVDEIKLLNALTSQGSRLAAGRFGGRDAKMERIRAQETKMAAEAAAKLGVPSSGTLERGTRGQSDTTTEASGLSSDLEAKKEEKKSKKKKEEEKASKKSKSSKKKGNESSKKKKKKKKRKTVDSDSESDGQSDDEDDGTAAKVPSVRAVEPIVKKQRIVIEPQGLYTTNGHSNNWNFTPTPRDGGWGASMFSSAGCLDGMKKDIKATERGEFTEDQQEKLYNAAQAGKTQGRVGLGQRSGTVKIGGVKWSGKKVAFEEEEEKNGVVIPSSENESDGEEKKKKRKADLKAVGSSTGLADLGDEKTSRKKESKKMKGNSKTKAGTDTGNDDPTEAEQLEPAADWVSSIKWKKVLTKTLEAAPGGELKLKALHSAVTATVIEKVGSVMNQEHVQVHVESTIASSSKFVVEGKRVRLVTAASKS